MLFLRLGQSFKKRTCAMIQKTSFIHGLLLLVLLAMSCGTKRSVQSSVVPVGNVLLDTVGWTVEKAADGLVRYRYSGYDSISAAHQHVNIVLVDPDRYQLAFDDVRPSDSLSSVVKGHDGAVAAINGTYYEIVRNAAGDSVTSSFFKTGGVIKSNITVPEGHRLHWKHEGIFYYDPADGQVGIAYGNKARYEAMPYPDMLSGSPMLIYDYKPVGETFAKPRAVPLDSLDYEDPDRHQGVRHPRTAVALTKEGYLMLIAVDGRRTETAGMSARELTRFIAHYFNPPYALNLDGGGSTTLWMRHAETPNGVVNYPTDNKQFDHYGQRKIRNAIVVLRKTQK